MAACECHRKGCKICYPEDDGTYDCWCGSEDCVICNPSK